MRILVVTEHLRERPFNGSEVACRSLVRALRRRHGVDVVARAGDDSSASEVTLAVGEEERTDPERLRSSLAERVRLDAYDVVYNLGALAFGCEVVTRLAPWDAGVPLVNHFQALLGPYARADGRPPDRQRSYAAGQMEVAARAALNVLASQGEVGAAREFGYELGGAVAVIPNGLSAGELDDVTPDDAVLRGARSGAGGRTIVIATAGRFSDYAKGADLVYRAFVRLYRHRQDVFLLSIANRDRFAYLLRELPERAYSLVDWLPRERFLAALAACDFLVVPSRYEPFGLIALEAQFLGRPVVANAVGGLAEIVHHGTTGLLTAAADGSLGLFLAMRHLAAHPERWAPMGEAARQRARREYGFERIYGQVEQSLDRATLDRDRAAEPAVPDPAAAPALALVSVA
jgi:glycosyltransferase involved in cell wall biosynthesis